MEIQARNDHSKLIIDTQCQEKGFQEFLPRLKKKVQLIPTLQKNARVSNKSNIFKSQCASISFVKNRS